MANVRLIIDIVNWGRDEAFFDHGLGDGIAIFNRVVPPLKPNFSGLPVQNAKKKCSSARRRAR
tara:strand:+ start:234 stop:422 length:189 start_codon:yes stop_codon:yes gene_type:complete